MNENEFVDEKNTPEDAGLKALYTKPVVRQSEVYETAALGGSCAGGKGIEFNVINCQFTS